MNKPYDVKLNQAVAHATAFGNWERMLKSINNGYCPTLREYKGDRKHNKAIRMIQQHMRVKGLRYFDGVKIIG